MPQNRVAEDVEHVVPVVGEGEGVDERVEVDYCQGYHQSSENVAGGDEELLGGWSRGVDERSEKRRNEQGSGEEGYEWPEVEELREVDCCDVIGFVALFC